MILAVGSMVSEALCAAALLAENHRIEATVVNARFIKPLDHGLIDPLARSIRRVITVGENTVQGGFGSAVLELLSEHEVKDVVVKRLGINDRFVEHGPQDMLRCLHEVDAAAIVKSALYLMPASDR